MSNSWEDHPERVKALLDDMDRLTLSMQVGSFEPAPLQRLALLQAAAELAGIAAGEFSLDELLAAAGTTEEQG